jgi:hypothetical protein
MISFCGMPWQLGRSVVWRRAFTLDIHPDHSSRFPQAGSLYVPMSALRRDTSKSEVHVINVSTKSQVRLRDHADKESQFDTRVGSAPAEYEELACYDMGRASTVIIPHPLHRAESRDVRSMLRRHEAATVPARRRELS